MKPDCFHWNCFGCTGRIILAFYASFKLLVGLRYLWFTSDQQQINRSLLMTDICNRVPYSCKKSINTVNSNKLDIVVKVI
jgi:hypothetical protein